jgi:branched-chain amino acid transport system permease protein
LLSVSRRFRPLDHFCVTRVVNFAHGDFCMLGAYIGYTLTDRFSGAVGFWTAIVLAAFCVAAIGTLIEMSLLRRVYEAPVLFQLLATFGVTLVVEDLVLLGPSELLGPRAPGFKGAIDLFGHPFPTTTCSGSGSLRPFSRSSGSSSTARPGA